MKLTYEQRRAEVLMLVAKDQVAYENIRRITNKYLFGIIAENIRYAKETGRLA